jgi:phosphoribosyl-dephospho-CoA transferase
MIPVGARGSSREQRFAGYLAREAVVDRVTPEELSSRGSWRESRRRQEIRAIEQLDSVFQIMSDFGFQWGPTGSVGFELATGFPAASKDSDLDLLIRAPDELKRDLCRCVRIRLSARVSVRTDVLIETGTGAIALDEYARGDLPIVLRSSNGPKLVYHPWKSVDECRLYISGAGIAGTGDVALPSEASDRSARSG